MEGLMKDGLSLKRKAQYRYRAVYTDDTDPDSVQVWLIYRLYIKRSNVLYKY